MRNALAAAAGLAVAVFGALVLGEYELRGVTAFVAAGLFGLVVGEVVVSVAPRPPVVLVLLAGATVVAAFVWSAWIAAGRDWAYAPDEAVPAAVLGGVAAAVWVRRPGRREAGSPSGP